MSPQSIRQGPAYNEAYSKKLPKAKPVYVIDFFCGCGGMSKGFADTRQSHLSFDVLAGIDIDDASLATYRRNVQADGINHDIGKLSQAPDDLISLVPRFSPETCRPLAFIGCAPCQGFSAHRKKDKRVDRRNTLMMAFAKICVHFRPDAIVMENVPEILTGKYQHFFEAAARELEDAGYNLTMDVLDMSLYGLPQRRRRAIIVGSLSSEIVLPEPVFSSDNVRTVRDAICHLPKIRSGETDETDPLHRAPTHTERILNRIRSTPHDGGDRRSISTKEQLACHIAIDNGKTPGFTDVYGRLRWDAPSVTITAKSSTPSCGRFLHPDQDRNISVREAGILQGFPQSFVFEGPFTHQYRQIGEAVPPLFARFLAWQVLDHFSPRSRQQLRLLATPQSSHLAPGRFAQKNPDLCSVDCFCGAGGLSLGLAAAGIKTSLAFDKSSDCIDTFNRNIAPVAIEADIQDPHLIAQITKAVDGKDYIVVGGPPCQGFSQQRRGDNQDPRNSLILSYYDLIASLEKKPLGVVLENVTYLDSPRGSDILEEYLEGMRALGYVAFRHDLNSADFSVPQLRRRIIVVCLLNKVSEYYRGPRATSPHRWPTVGEYLHGLSNTTPECFAESLPNHQASREGSTNRRRIAFVDMGKGRMGIPPFLQLPCHKKYGGHLDVYGRLDYFSQARTITAGFDSFTRGEYAHPFYHRSITPREAARFQGFPDWFVFEGNRASLRKQIGNAVPPPVGLAIGKAILRAAKEK